MKSTELKYLYKADWQKIKGYISKVWGKTHPLTDQRLFLWQHTGPLTVENPYLCTALEENSEIVGLRCIQQLDFQLKNETGSLTTIRGCTAPFMFVSKSHRGIAGLRLYRRTLSDFPVVLFLGANTKTTLKLHQKSGYKIFHELPRYGIQHLESCTRHKISLTDQSINIFLLSDLWRKYSLFYKPFAIYRDERFFDWRYKLAPYWNYRMLVSSNNNAVVVYRLEPFLDKTGNMARAIRLVEFFYDPEKCTETELVAFSSSIIEFSISLGCSYTDHFQTMVDSQVIFEKAGFTRISADTKDFPVLFNPLSYDKPAINYGWFTKENFGYEESCHYITKTDSDQDRPQQISHG